MQYNKNDEVIFRGYEDLEEGQESFFEKGDILVIDEVADRDTYIAFLRDDPSVMDQVFASEIKLLHPQESQEKDDVEEDPVFETVAIEADEDETSKPKNTKKAAAKKQIAKKVAAKKNISKGTAKQKSAPVKEPAKQKAAPVKDHELAPLDINVYSEEVRKLVSTDTSALDAAKSLSDKIQNTFWDLGGVLSFIRRNKSYQQIEKNGENPYMSNEGFAKYAEEELGIGYRMAMYYIDIYESFSKCGLKDPSLVLAIGWSKAKEVTRVITPDNYEEWVDIAKESTREDLCASVKETRVKLNKGEDNTIVKKTAFKFQVFQDQATMVVEALGEAKAVIDTEDLNAALVHICTEWLSMNGGNRNTSIDDAMLSLEQTYGLNEVSQYVRERFK